MFTLMTAIISLVFGLLFVLTVFSVITGAPYVPTNNRQMEILFRLSNIKEGERMIDLGSGDGKIVIFFAKKGFAAVGYEINPLLVLWSRFKIKKAGVDKLARVYWGSFWKLDLGNYDVVTIYGIGHIMSALSKKLDKELKKGTRTLSVVYEIQTWNSKEREGSIYLYEK